MKKSLIVLLVAGFITPAFAEKPSSNDDEMMAKETRVEQLAGELGLTEEQKTKIKTNREKYKTQITDKETAFNLAREKFTVVVQNPNASTSEIESAHRQKEDAQRELADLIFKSRMEFRDVLTPEQRTKMISKREMRMDKREDHKGKIKEMRQNKKDKKE